MFSFNTSVVPLWPKDDSNNQFIYYISGGYIIIYFLIFFISYVSRRREPSVVVIPPNESFQDEHLLHKYLLKIKTSTSKGSSCHSLARIYIQMVGRNSSSPYFPVDVFYSGRFLFQRGCTDIFLFKVVDYLGEIDVLNFLIVKSKKSSWKPVDVTAMHVASGRSWKVCYKITDIDSCVVEEGQSEDQKQRGAIGQCVKWVLKYHTWLSSMSIPIRYGAYTTRIHVLFLFWGLSVQALCVLVIYCVSPQQGSNQLPYAIFQSCVATCFLSLLLGSMKFLLHEVRSGSKQFRKLSRFKSILQKEIIGSKEVLNINISRKSESFCLKSEVSLKSENVETNEPINEVIQGTDRFRSAISISRSFLSIPGFEDSSFFSIGSESSSTVFHDVNASSDKVVTVASLKTYSSPQGNLLSKISVAWKSNIMSDKFMPQSVEIFKIASPEMDFRHFAQNMISYVRKAFQDGVANILKKRYKKSVNLIQRCIEILYSNIEDGISCLDFKMESMKKEQKVFPNQVQQRKVILNMIKHVVDRATVNPSLIAGESLMICHELFCYYRILDNVELYQDMMSKLQHPVEHIDQLLEHSVFKVIQSCCETIYQTPVCLHGTLCLTEGNNSLSRIIQSVMEGDIARDHAVYRFSCDIIENAELEVTLEHQFAENVYLEFTIKQAILNELRSICHSGVLLHDDETNLQEVRSSLYRKWQREGLQPKLDNRAQLAEVLLLQYVKNLNEAGLLKGSDILQNTTDFQYLQHMLERILAIEVQNNLKFTAMSFVSKYENQQDFESDIEVQMNSAAMSMGRVLATLTSRVIYEEILQQRAQNLVSNILQELEHDVKLQRAMQENCCIKVESEDSLTETEIQGLREDLVPMKCFLKYVMVERIENQHRGLPASFINKRWNFHKQFTTQAYDTLTEAGLILDEDSVDKSLKPKLLYELEWDMTGENRKWLPGSLMRLFALFLFTTTVFCVVYVALTAAQLTVDQVTEWFACLLVALALYGLVWEVLLSISVGKIQERLN